MLISLVNVPPIAAQTGAEAATSIDTIGVWRAVAAYLRSTVGPRLMLKSGPLCTPGTNLCADSETVAAHQHATSAATGLPEVTGPVKMTCARHICRFDDINGIVGFGIPQFDGATAIIRVSMSIRPKGAPANWYELDELQLTRGSNGWTVTGRQRLSIT